MPRRCDTCTHTRAQEIDAELRRPDRATFEELAKRFGLKRPALERHHANHMLRSAARFAGVALLPPDPVPGDVVGVQPVDRVLTAGSTSPAPPPPSPPATEAQQVEQPPRKRTDAGSIPARGSVVIDLPEHATDWQPVEPLVERTLVADWPDVPQTQVPAPQDSPLAAVAVEPPRPLTMPQQKTKFLELLAEFGSIGRACREVGIPRSRVNKWLEVDELFGFAYHQAQAVATERLEEVARERATRGARYEKQVWRHGHLVETTVEFRPSDAALITLLKAQKPDTYRERIDQNVAGEVSVRYTNDWRAHHAQAEVQAPA